MSPKKLVSVSEQTLIDINKQIFDLEEKFNLNHPTRLALSDLRIKMNGVIRQNRQVPNVDQMKWVYVVESDVCL